MSRFDSDHAYRDTEAGDTAVVGRLLERYAVPVKVAAFYAVVLAAGVGMRRLVDGPNLELLLSIGIWFTIIFAACTALLGGVVKAVAAVQRYRHSPA